MTDHCNLTENYRLNPGRLCRLSITSDSQDAVESRVKVGFFKGSFKNKNDEAEVVLKNGQTKSWEYSKDKGIQSLKIEVAKGGGVKVRIEQPVAKENAAGPKPAPKIADATPWKPVPKSTAEKFTNSLGMKFVYIKPGSFMMGSPSSEPGRDNNERQHKVTLTKGFYAQTTEVTQGQWKAVMRYNPSYFKHYGDGCPVEKVSWNDA
ncbi:MAG: SUMF1/EgtB/PvdO family nonheme iron enzyme, partial [Deltaproteobacteria bacterium]|nr:SUMF1/EgtB/PvdO family nonheme iron enzyme [Deltaproteobacteria bacterium]